MLTLYGLILLLLLIAISLLAIPYVIEKKISSKHFLLTASGVIIFSLSLYGLTYPHVALKAWLANGKQHYELQEQVAQMGGISGMILKIKHHLERNPDDSEGWRMLGKLYSVSGDEENAKKAYGKIKKQ